MKKWLLLFTFVFSILLFQAPTDASTFYEVKVVNNSALVMKDHATQNATTIATLKLGDFVTVFSTEDGWSHIQSQSTTGYVEASFLSPASSTIKIASSKGGLVVKQSPSKSAKTMATLQYNMIVEDFGQVGNGWSFVQYGNITGYVASSFIGSPKTVTKTTTTTVSLRNIASKSGAISTSLPANTKVTVHATIAGWAFISTDTKRGYTEASLLKKNKIIVIDPGHQEKGDNSHEPIGPGATATKPKVSSGTAGVATRKPEYKLTLEASVILKQLLEKEGYEVYLTRDTHQINISNSQRAAIANKKQADLFIRIHADGSTNKNTRGFSVLVPGKNNHYTAPIFTESEKAGKSILATVKPHVPIFGQGLFYRTDLSGFNWAKVPTVLIEMGFMTNPTEDRLLSDSTYLTNLMNYMTTGVNQYFK